MSSFHSCSAWKWLELIRTVPDILHQEAVMKRVKFLSLCAYHWRQINTGTSSCVLLTCDVVFRTFVNSMSTNGGKSLMALDLIATLSGYYRIWHLRIRTVKILLQSFRFFGLCLWNYVFVIFVYIFRGFHLSSHECEEHYTVPRLYNKHYNWYVYIEMCLRLKENDLC